MSYNSARECRKEQPVSAAGVGEGSDVFISKGMLYALNSQRTVSSAAMSSAKSPFSFGHNQFFRFIHSFT